MTEDAAKDEKRTGGVTARAAAGIPDFGRLVSAAGVFGLGVTGLAFADFALQWQPVPADIPGRTLLAYGSGTLLVLIGAALALRRTARIGAFVLAATMAVWVLALHAPRVLTGVPWSWLGFAEFIALTAAAWILVAWLTPEAARRGVFGPPGRRAALIVFALCLPAFGASHLIAIEGAARFVPPWLPVPEVWVVATGLGHIAAGLALLTGILARLAGVLFAAMLSSFVLLVHVPDLVSDPSSHRFWTMLFVATMLSGAAWTVAGSVLAGRGPHEAATAR